MTTGACITLRLPLPPTELRANSRAHYHAKKRAADEYSELVATTLIGTGLLYDRGFPWRRARVRYVWCHAGRPPDVSNLGGHTKYLQDILAAAPRLSLQQSERYRRCHLGIVDDDANFEPTYRAVKVARRADECVEVEIMEVA